MSAKRYGVICSPMSSSSSENKPSHSFHLPPTLELKKETKNGQKKKKLAHTMPTPNLFLKRRVPKAKKKIFFFPHQPNWNWNSKHYRHGAPDFCIHTLGLSTLPPDVPVGLRKSEEFVCLFFFKKRTKIIFPNIENDDSAVNR